MNDNSYKVIEVDINEILPNRFQPRIQFDEEEILELSDSIKEHGVIQPLVVRTIGDKYEIIAGERRYKASVLAGKETVPVIIKNLNDKDSAEIALIENIQRKNLTPIEEALSYKKILDMGYLTQENLASKLGKSQSSVANKIRLLNLSDEVQEALLDNKISERHARSLLRLKSYTEQNDMLSKITKERLTVRKTDEEIDKILNPIDEQISELNVEEEKEVEKMNVENNQIPTVVTPPSNSNFDIFGGNSQVNIPAAAPAIPSIPAVEPVAIPSVPVTAPITESIPAVSPVVESAPQTQGIQFDANGNVIAMNEPTAAPVIPSIPAVEPVATPSVPVTAPITESTPAVSPVVESAPQTQGIQFDANGNVIAMNEPTAAPVLPSIPAVEPVAIPSVPVTAPITESTPAVSPVVESAPQTQGIQFDANGNVITMNEPTAAPVIPSIPAVEPVATPSVPVTAPITESTPAVSPVVESAPQTQGIQFDANGNVIAMNEPAAAVIPSIPAVEPVAIPNVPVTAPIIESTPAVSPVTPIEPVSISQFPALETPTIAAPVAPEPIIITDYSKQYDPVMPVTTPVTVSKVDFKEIINAIRECSEKIEKYGYKIDVEEYDLSTLYQVVFKIEK